MAASSTSSRLYMGPSCRCCSARRSRCWAPSCWRRTRGHGQSITGCSVAAAADAIEAQGRHTTGAVPIAVDRRSEPNFPPLSVAVGGASPLAWAASRASGQREGASARPRSFSRPALTTSPQLYYRSFGVCPPLVTRSRASPSRQHPRFAAVPRIVATSLVARLIASRIA